MLSPWHTKTPHLLDSNTILSNKWGAVQWLCRGFSFFGIIRGLARRVEPVDLAAKGVYRVPAFERELREASNKALADAAVRISGELAEESGDLFLAATCRKHLTGAKLQPLRANTKLTAYIGNQPSAWAAAPSINLRRVGWGDIHAPREIGFITTAFAIDNFRDAIF